MAREQIIVGLDVGTTAVKTVVAQKSRTQLLPQIIGWGFADSRGVKKGVVDDIEEAASAISESFEKARTHAGVKFDEAIVSIGGDHVAVRPSRGIAMVSRADRVISNEDIERALSQASSLTPIPNRELLHNLPQAWSVDDDRAVKDPLGMTGSRLEVNTLLIEGFSKSIKDLRKAADLAGIRIKELVFTPLAASRAVLNRKQRDLGALVLDIGGGTTSMAVFEEGDITHAMVLPFGSHYVTRDLVKGLVIDAQSAERLKKAHGSAFVESTSSRDMVDLKKFGGEKTIERKVIAEICEARFSEILEQVQKQIKGIKKSIYLPGGVVLTGGGSKIPRLDKLAKNELSLPTARGIAGEILGPEEILQDSSYATALGLVLWGFDEGKAGSASGDIEGFWKNLRDLLKKFAP